MSRAHVAVERATQVEFDTLPRHVAIIMDGNGRWARQRRRPRIFGHRRGARAVRSVVEECGRLGIECLTLYSFSADNWKRPRDEVSGLMSLYSHYLRVERAELHARNVRVLHLGRRDGLPEAVLNALDKTIELTRQNTGLKLCLALNYGARHELVDAIRTLAGRVQRGELEVDRIDARTVSEALYTAGLPDPDLVIRTASEQRISDFLLWQISYAEFFASDVLWPDFGVAHLHEAIRTFASRERRFGDVAPAGGLSQGPATTDPLPPVD